MGCEVRKTGAHPDLFCPNRPNYAIIMMMPGGMPGGGMGGGRAPMLVLNPNTQRQGDDSTKTQTQNVGAAKAVGDLIRTCLGPKAMLKMLMDPMGGIVMTNDGNAILREITVQNPAAKMLIEIARTQDEEVGDGTTSVVVLAAEIMGLSLPFLKDKIHPTTLIDDSQVLNGVMFNKDVVHPKMARKIEKPRVVLMDCGLEYKKGESVTNMEFTAATDFTAALQMEEEQ